MLVVLSGMLAGGETLLGTEAGGRQPSNPWFAASQKVVFEPIAERGRRMSSNTF